jgi:hypothetical protein
MIYDAERVFEAKSVIEHTEAKPGLALSSSGCTPLHKNRGMVSEDLIEQE